MAIAVITHGKNYSYITKRFLCSCGCYFEADEASYFRDDSFMLPRSACHCPECGNIAFEVLQNTVIYK